MARGHNLDHQNATAPEMNFVWEILAIYMYNNHLAMYIGNDLGKQTSVPCLSVRQGNCPFAFARSLLPL